jgi:hypothetical protein
MSDEMEGGRVPLVFADQGLNLHPPSPSPSPLLPHVFECQKGVGTGKCFNWTRTFGLCFRSLLLCVSLFVYFHSNEKAHQLITDS